MLLLTASPLAVSDDSDIASQMKACSLKADRNDRLACFDELNREVNAPTDVSATAAVAATGTASTDSSSKSEAAEAESGVPVNVVSCQSGASDEYIFALDNGEVWKQVSSKRLRLSECNFAARIDRDFFGYKMIIEEDNTKFRVKRLR
jgi:hypothetical protein